MSMVEKQRWVIRGLVVLVVVLSLTAGLFAEALRMDRRQLKKLQNTVELQQQ